MGKWGSTKKKIDIYKTYLKKNVYNYANVYKSPSVARALELEKYCYYISVD